MEIPAVFSHYFKKEVWNNVTCHSWSEDTFCQTAEIPSEVKTAKELCSEIFNNANEYQILIYILKEQTVMDTEEFKKLSSFRNVVEISHPCYAGAAGLVRENLNEVSSGMKIGLLNFQKLYKYLWN